jgi:hypothetical protein
MLTIFERRRFLYLRINATNLDKQDAQDGSEEGNIACCGNPRQ